MSETITTTPADEARAAILQALQAEPGRVLLALWDAAARVDSAARETVADLRARLRVAEAEANRAEGKHEALQRALRDYVDAQILHRGLEIVGSHCMALPDGGELRVSIIHGGDLFGLGIRSDGTLD